MTEAVQDRKPSPLAGIVVDKPETANEKTRRYLCGIRDLPNGGHLDRIVGVGPATFGKHSFVWEGSGADAKQVEIKGVINVLTDRQVEEVRSKLRFRYLRPVYGKNGLLVGAPEIDASDSGGILVDRNTGVETPRPPEKRPGRTGPNDIPLVDYLTMDVVYEDKAIRGRVVTLEEARRVVAEAEAEVNRPLESVDATFETGRGGKTDKAEKDPKVDEALHALANARPSIASTPDVAQDSFGGSKRVAGGKSATGGAGRLPEK